MSEGLIHETSLHAPASPPRHAEAGARRLAVLLAWIAGGVDAIGYLALAHLFTAHMSGNTVALGAAVGSGETAELARRGVAIVLFAAGIALGTALGEVRRERGGRHPIVPVLGVEMILLLLFVVLGEAQQIPPPEDPRFYLMVAFPTIAMGLQSATLRRIGDIHVRTTYISGVLTNLMEAVVHRLFRRKPDKDLDVKIYGSVWGSYLLGAILGGVGYTRAGPLGMLLPLIGLGCACALDLRHPYEVAVDAP